MLDAIESRQGSLPDADLSRIKLVRGINEYNVNLKTYLENGSIRDNPRLRGGDVLVVTQLNNNEVYVMGEVNTPRVVPIGNQPLSLTQALASSDGINKTTANARGIFVFRYTREGESIEVYQLDIKDPAALLLGTRFQLARGDVVYATSAPAARWNRIIGNLIPSLSALNTLLLIEDRS